MSTITDVAEPVDRAGDDRSTTPPPGRKAHLLRPHVPRLVTLVVLQVIGSVAGLAPLLAIVELGRSTLASGPVDTAHVVLTVGIGAAGLFVRLGFTGAATALGHVVDLEVQSALRLRLASHLGRVPLGWLSRRRSGELSKVVGEDVSALHPAVAHAPGELVSAFVVPAVSLVYLFYVDWRMTLITLIPVLVAIALIPLMMTSAKLTEQREFDAAMGRMRDSLVELIRCVTVIKMFGGPEGTGLRFRRAAEEFVTAFRRWVQGMAGPAAAMQLALSPPVVILTVLIGGTLLVTGGHLPAADLIPFLLLGLGLTAPVAALGHGFDDLQAAHRALGRIREVLGVLPLPVPARPKVPDGFRLELRGVCFSYEEHEVLNDVDLILEPGTTTAIVGPSGSGKSTLAHLLLRFADPTRGTVYLGGTDLRDLDTRTLNRSIVAVLQDAQVLRATVAENIAITVPDADEESIIEAARLANIHDRITELSRGYHSVLGEDVHLSGGETQRIALARALLARAPVLVLDEATAFADPLTERTIRHAVQTTSKDRTTVIIAHRLDTIADADQVVVLEHGKIVEAGPPRQLRARGGRFSDLWRASSNATHSLGGDDR